MIYHHSLDPVAFYLGSTAVPYYWLNYLISYVFVYICSSVLARRQLSPLQYTDVPIYALGCWVGVLIGGRIGYILIYRIHHYILHPDEIYQIWLGGMSFHGALIGCAISCLFIAHLKQQNPLWASDVFCMLIPLPLALGRFTNFLNAELIGKATSSGLWGVVYAYDPEKLTRHPSQLYQAALEGLLLFVILISQIKHLRHTPGLMSCLFLIGYGALRIIAEFFRLPDPQIGYLLGPITMGHLLCTLMIIGGCTGWILIKRNSPSTTMI